MHIVSNDGILQLILDQVQLLIDQAVLPLVWAELLQPRYGLVIAHIQLCSKVAIDEVEHPSLEIRPDEELNVQLI